MPGFDGTGPMGQGPMSGRERGYCAVPLTGTRRPFLGRGFWCRGGGRGWRNWYQAAGFPGWARTGTAYTAFGIDPNDPELTPTQEMSMLKQDTESLKVQLEDIQNRIEALEKMEKEQKNK